MSATKYDNGNTTALQITDSESDNKLTIIQSPSFGKELMLTVTGNGIASSIVINDTETLQKIRDYIDESINWMEA